MQHLSASSIITGWDFGTTGVKCLAFDLDGNTLADVRLPNDLWTHGHVSELNLMQLEGQARGTVRAMAEVLRGMGRLRDWVAGGISATHHSNGRIDANHNQVRRAFFWDDPSLQPYHKKGLARLGGPKAVRKHIGGPWAIRYSLSHLVKDEANLSEVDWKRTAKILSHGSLAAGYLTGNFNVASISSAASTGIMNLRTGAWCDDMLGAIKSDTYRELARAQLPTIVDQFDLVGPLHPGLVLEAGIEPKHVPLIFPTSDDQQAGLVGGGAVDAGQMAVILGTSAVVNSSSDTLPTSDDLDAMRLNWGPYLWMRCYSNGAKFVNKVVGDDPDWVALEAAAREVEPGCDGTVVVPFLDAEPSLGVMKPDFRWEPKKPKDPGTRYRAALEALGYLIVLGVKQHEASGQKITRITVSGGMARSELMCEILASMLARPLELLVSNEGPALGAAVTALAAIENHQRRERGEPTAYTVADAVAQMVKFRGQAHPRPDWHAAYEKGLRKFMKHAGIRGKRG